MRIEETRCKYTFWRKNFMKYWIQLNYYFSRFSFTACYLEYTSRLVHATAQNRKNHIYWATASFVRNGLTTMTGETSTKGILNLFKANHVYAIREIYIYYWADIYGTLDNLVFGRRQIVYVILKTINDCTNRFCVCH